MHFDLLVDRKFIKKSMLILSTSDFYLEVKSEDVEFIFKAFNERYNYIQYNEDYKE
jgi:hypothetical protein